MSKYDDHFGDREPAEAKHHNKQRKRQQYVIPLVTASERGPGQTESDAKSFGDVECGPRSGLTVKAESSGMLNYKG